MLCIAVVIIVVFIVVVVVVVFVVAVAEDSSALRAPSKALPHEGSPYLYEYDFFLCI